MNRRALATALLLAGSAPVMASPTELTAAEVADAPRPGEEHGRKDVLDPGDSLGRKLGRIALWIPRLPIELITLPVRAVLLYQGKRQAGAVKDEAGEPVRVIGFSPRFVWQTGFNPHVGLRVGFDNIAGDNESVGIRLGYGGHLGGVIAVDANTGERFGDVQLGVEARYDSRDDERFFGYGNYDIEPAGAMPVDPQTTMTALSTRYETHGRRVTPYARYRPTPNFYVDARGAAIDKRFQISDDPLQNGDVSIEQGFDTTRIPGFVDGASFLRAELELAWDTRRAVDPYDPPAIKSSGTLVLAHASRFQDLSGSADFYRYGFDLQQDLRLTAGPRTIELRLAGEAITGDLDQVPFTEVPAIGGDLYRSAHVDRFRDRVAVVGRAGYLWALGSRMAAVLFGEAGRVYRDPRDLTLSGMRYGAGLAIEGYTAADLAFSGHVAVSLDGGVYFNLSLTPVQDGRSRVRD